MERVRVSVCTLFVGNSDLPDPNIKYLLERERERERKREEGGRGKKWSSGFSTGCGEIRRIDYGSFVPPPSPGDMGCCRGEGGGGG